MEMLKGAKLTAAIKSIKTRSETLDKDIHKAAVSSIAHFMEHGNCTAMTQLVEAVGKAARKEALTFWFREHANVRWQRVEKGSDEFHFVKGNKELDEKALLEQAIDTPFWQFTKEKSQTEFDAMKYAGSVARRLIKEQLSDKEFNQFITQLRSERKAAAA